MKSQPVEVRSERETVFSGDTGLHYSDCERIWRQHSAGTKFFDGKIAS